MAFDGTNAMKIRNALNKHPIRLYYDGDMDGAVAGLLIKLFSGAVIAEEIQAHANFPKKPGIHLNDGTKVLDVFVDCRAKDRNEDIRIDHHASGESKDYLAHEGIIVDSRYDSAVTLVADVLGIRDQISPSVLRTMDKSDSGRITAFSKCKYAKDIFQRILKEVTKEDLKSHDAFKTKILTFMDVVAEVEAVVPIKDIGRERLEMQAKLAEHGVVIEHIKKTPRSPLTKLIYTPPNHKGVFKIENDLIDLGKKTFKMDKGEFFANVNNNVTFAYYEQTGKMNMATYTVIGYYSPKNWKGEANTEPYELFLARSPFNANLDMGKILQRAKVYAKISNGGGRAGVAGLNTDDINKAKKALYYIIQVIRKNCR